MQKSDGGKESYVKVMDITAEEMCLPLFPIDIKRQVRFLGSSYLAPANSIVCMTVIVTSFQPWLDLTMSCESWMTNTMDYLPTPPRSEHKFNPISFYCSGRDKMKTLARHPYISPLWGNLTGLPPLLIQCGEAERLRDECLLFTHKAGGSFGSYNKHPFQPTTQPRQQNSHVELDMYPGMVHVFQAIPLLPESSMALQRILEFMERKEAEKQAEKQAEKHAEKQAEKQVEMQAEVVAAAASTDDVVMALQVGQAQAIMEQLMEEIVESTAIQLMEDLPPQLLAVDDLQMVEGEAVACQA